MFRISFIYCISFIFLLSDLSGQNIALHKPYTYSAAPNYSTTAPATDKVALTDGIYTNVYFWSKPTTVGWQRTQVTITIDLGKVQPISQVNFNTARFDKAGVQFPDNIFLFISNNDKNYSYVGDIANTPDNLPGAYLVKKLVLGELEIAARYISLIVIPDGKYIFCDEIEVLKGKNGALLLTKSIPKIDLIKVTDSLKSIEFNRKNLVRVVGNLQNISFNGDVNKEFAGIQAKLKQHKSQAELNELKKSIQLNHALNLKNTYKTPFILEKYNPWDSLTEFHKPTGSIDNLSYQFIIADEGVQYGAFVLTNTQPFEQEFTFKVTNTHRAIFDLEIFNVFNVPSMNFIKIPDPLIPIKNSIKIESGISTMILFKIVGNKCGSAESEISVQLGSKKVSIRILTCVVNLFKGNKVNLNANNWAYLTYPMIKDRPAEAVKDLLSHRINTIDIPPTVIPPFGSNNYEPFLNYLSYFKGIKNILLFTSYTSEWYCKNSGAFMSARWKRDFVEWYTKLIKVIEDNGFSRSQIYMFPYDEVYGDYLKDFEIFARWVKKALPDIKLYATLSRENAVESILPLVDIAQIKLGYNLFHNLPKHQGDIWIYGVLSHARSLSPYEIYRLMAWKAFLNGAKGIGFWNYADEGRSKVLNLITDPLINPSRSYSVIYNGPGKSIISSRRWEAFRLGIEDYSIISLYAKRFGSKKAKGLVQQVLNNPKNIGEADKVRMVMLKALL